MDWLPLNESNPHTFLQARRQPSRAAAAAPPPLPLAVIIPPTIRSFAPHVEQFASEINVAVRGRIPRILMATGGNVHTHIPVHLHRIDKDSIQWAMSPSLSKSDSVSNRRRTCCGRELWWWAWAGWMDGWMTDWLTGWNKDILRWFSWGLAWVIISWRWIQQLIQSLGRRNLSYLPEGEEPISTWPRNDLHISGVSGNY